MNIHRMALLCGVLKNEASIDILVDLLDKNKTFIFFEKKYNKSIASYTLLHLASIDLIQKIFDETKLPIGYKLTPQGRWVTHSCIGFKKQLEQIPQ